MEMLFSGLGFLTLGGGVGSILAALWQGGHSAAIGAPVLLRDGAQFAVGIKG